MDEVVGLLVALGRRPALDRAEVAAALAGRGWRPVPRPGTAGAPRGWELDDHLLGIQGDAPHLRVEITLRCWEYDERAAAEAEDFAWLEAAWQRATDEARRLAARLQAAGPPFPGAPVTLPADEAEEFLWHAAWSLAGRQLVVGAEHQDRELPIRVLAAIS
ncbi:hypothetical protein RM844_22810 [Streptomyces sp. DSM 44915]|uniref:Uncharacterized protein n=1 Tax=Streptomyces chisholmiae TaxID=3075540 RepID=A0ABU2JW84_9ACTN|nr:hypothetical protein [Streptomyces sp. DSM 44915]MDT0269122.1 hypothetical protein [Streptomyces sp. DSM 44915]